MSKLHELADSAPSTLSRLETRAGALTERLRAVNVRGNEALDRWDGYITEQEQAAAAVESAINKLSNAPPPASPVPAPKSPPVTDTSAPVAPKNPPVGVTLNPDFHGR
jgi:hypothetical protein